MTNIFIGIVSWVVAFFLIGTTLTWVVIWARIFPIMGAIVVFFLLPIAYPKMLMFLGFRILWSVGALVVFLFIHKRFTKGGK